MTIYDIGQRKALVETALGRHPYDLIVQNVQVVNVYSGEVTAGAIGIKHGRVVTIAASEDAQALQTFDGQGLYALPGFIDSHIHVDSTLVTPESLAELIIPAGTTTLLADPMEIANVAGFKGIEALLQAAATLPYHIFIEVSSRVPTAPGLETTGGELNLKDVKRILEWPTCISLGELDPSKVLGLGDEYFSKIQAAYALNKIANGHGAGLDGDRLVAYACAGLADDHECVTYQEALDRLRLGMPVLVREGSTERNLQALIAGVLADARDTRHWMFCTDDKHPDDIRNEGHIDCMINDAIQAGLPPMQAIQMATINAALHFRLEQEIGSLSPGRWADIVLVERLERIEPRFVFFKGRIIAQEGQLLEPVPLSSYPDWLRHSVKVLRGDKAEHFVLPAEGESATVRVVELYPDQIINDEGQAELPVVKGNIMSDIETDTLKVAVVERYGKNGNIGIAFVRGFGLKQGAISSSVAHDHHNIIVVGTNEADMAACVRATEAMQGGLVATVGTKVLAQLPLPLGGLLSEEPVDDVIEQLEQLNSIVAELMGCRLSGPFMTLSFLSLPTVPEFGLTDMGLVRVRDHKLISSIVSD